MREKTGFGVRFFVDYADTGVGKSPFGRARKRTTALRVRKA
mgnify:CR=1 FL=1